jgi:hypothetical protein
LTLSLTPLLKEVVCTAAEVPVPDDELKMFVEKTEKESGITIYTGNLNDYSENWMLDIMTNLVTVDRIESKMDQGLDLFDAVMEDFLEKDLAEPDLDLFDRTEGFVKVLL